MPARMSSEIFSVFSDDIFLRTSLNSGYSFFTRSKSSRVSTKISQYVKAVTEAVRVSLRINDKSPKYSPFSNVVWISAFWLEVIST